MSRSLRLLCLAGIALSACCDNPSHRNYPQPKEGQTLVYSHESEENQSNRKAWIESMHKAPPGVDWRSIELDNQRRKATNLRRENQIQKMVV